MTRPANLTGAAVLALLTGCSTPDLSQNIAETRALLASTLGDVKADFDASAAEDLRAAERQAAKAGEKILGLPGTCLARIDAGPEFDVSDCAPRPEAAPLEGPGNAYQLRAAFISMDRYFGALEALATAKTSDAVKTNAAALLEALGATDPAGRSEQLTRIAAGARRDGPAIAAVAGFVVEQQRIIALRRVMIAADPALEEIVRNAEVILEEMGSPTRIHRDRVTAAIAAYDAAFLSGSSSRQLAAAEVLRQRVKQMHAAEAKSPIRRLFMARHMHGAMLAHLLRSPDLDQLRRLSTQIADINTLLENRK